MFENVGIEPGRLGIPCITIRVLIVRSQVSPLYRSNAGGNISKKKKKNRRMKNDTIELSSKQTLHLKLPLNTST